jgi:prepilin peptidase dependent protein B
MLLIELMIAAVIALVVLSAVLTVYGATVRHSRLQRPWARLHQQLYGMVHLIGRDLRRAGYWHFDPARHSPVENPFQDATNRLRSGAFPGEPADSCVLLAYDLDADGLVGVGRCRNRHCPPLSDDSNVEQFGFRLHNGALQSRYAGTGLDCGSGYWQALNDPAIEITHLQFTLHAHCINLTDPDAACRGSAPRLVQRVVRVSVGARLRNRPETEIGRVRWITVRNDRLVEGHR